MRMKRWICLAMVLVLALAVPSGALAAKRGGPSIKLPVKVGFMPLGATVTLKAKLRQLTRDMLTFESSDPGVASVTQSGELHAASVGRSVITVSGGGARAKIGIVVLPLSVSVKAGETYSLPYGTVERFAVRDRDVAAVNGSGVILGRKAGTTQVGVKYGRQLLTLEVNVTGAAAAATAPVESGAQDSKVAGLAAASKTDQIVLVEYSGGSKATLSVHEKVNGTWKQLMETPAYVGKNGIGKTKEGDKKTPSGTYNLTTPFGIKADPGAQMPYTKVTKYHYWCGDSSSEYYNKLVDERKVDRKHTSSDEYLIKYKGVYNYCLFIDYNAEGTPHKGSCIFLHCTGSNKYTAGCVAVPEKTMKKIVQWARAGAKIVIREK